MLSTVAALILPEFVPFGAGVLSEVFGLDRAVDGVPPMEFRVCGPVAGEALPGRAGAAMVPSHGLDGLRGADLVAVSATDLRAFDEPVLAALRAAAADGTTILSVCSGVFVLGAAGLLDDRPCTAHWADVEALRAAHPRARVDADVLFVDDGDLITSAGTAAGIDACLHVVRRELGSAAGNAIARRMMVSAQRDGGQRQCVRTFVPTRSAGGLGPILEWLLDHLDVEHSVSDLARRARMSDRSFARRFVAETGTTPHRWLTAQRVQCAQRLLETTDLSVEAIAGRCGIGSAALLRYHFRKIVGVGPADFRRTSRTPPG